MERSRNDLWHDPSPELVPPFFFIMEPCMTIMLFDDTLIVIKVVRPILPLEIRVREMLLQFNVDWKSL